MSNEITIQDVFHQFLPEYSETHLFSTEQHMAALCISKCRTAEMGANISECESCHKKYIHYVEDQLKGMMKSKTFPIMRYAEVLLNYVEALNELGSNTYTDEENGITVSRDVDEMVKYFNMVRYRAGLPGITADDARDVTTMRDLIKRERRVEFFCEGRRYHDLRRWGDAIDAYNEPVTGMNIAARSTDRKAFHTETVINNTRSHRVFSYKDYFLPIPRTTMDKNPKLVQNPGW